MSPSIAFLAGTRVNAPAMRSSDLAAIGRPARAALIVAGLSRDSRARSVADHPRRTISNRSLPECTTTLMAGPPRPAQVVRHSLGCSPLLDPLVRIDSWEPLRQCRGPVLTIRRGHKARSARRRPVSNPSRPLVQRRIIAPASSSLRAALGSLLRQERSWPLPR